MILDGGTGKPQDCYSDNHRKRGIGRWRCRPREIHGHQEAWQDLRAKPMGSAGLGGKAVIAASSRREGLSQHDSNAPVVARRWNKAGHRAKSFACTVSCVAGGGRSAKLASRDCVRFPPSGQGTRAKPRFRRSYRGTRLVLHVARHGACLKYTVLPRGSNPRRDGRAGEI